MCNSCIHAPVCGKCKATGGQVGKCEHFKEERRGRWEPDIEVFDADPAVGVPGGEIQTGWKCSVCGRSEPGKEPYCHCGARMDGKRKMIALEDIVDLDAQTAANNEAMRKVIGFIAGERRDGE